jgi:WD40 repeat protein
MAPIRRSWTTRACRLVPKAMVVCFIIVFPSVTPITFAASPPVTALSFTSDSNNIVSGSQAGLTIESLDGRVTKKRITSLENIHAISISPNRNMFLVAGGAPAQLGSIELLTWRESKPHAVYELHEDLIYAASWRPDGKRFVTAGGDSVCHVVDVATGKITASFKGHSRRVLAVVFLADGKTIVSAGIDETLRVWRAADGSEIRTRHNHTAAVNALALKPVKQNNDRSVLPVIASASADRTVRFWQPTIGRMMRFARLPSEPLAVAWLPDGTKLLASCKDGGVYQIDPNTVKTKLVKKVKGWATSLVVSNDGKFAAVGTDRVAVISLDAR